MQRSIPFDSLLVEWLQKENADFDTLSYRLMLMLMRKGDFAFSLPEPKLKDALLYYEEIVTFTEHMQVKEMTDNHYRVIAKAYMKIGEIYFNIDPLKPKVWESFNHALNLFYEIKKTTEIDNTLQIFCEEKFIKIEELHQLKKREMEEQHKLKQQNEFYRKSAEVLFKQAVHCHIGKQYNMAKYYFDYAIRFVEKIKYCSVLDRGDAFLYHRLLSFVWRTLGNEGEYRGNYEISGRILKALSAVELEEDDRLNLGRKFQRVGDLYFESSALKPHDILPFYETALAWLNGTQESTDDQFALVAQICVKVGQMADQQEVKDPMVPDIYFYEMAIQAIRQMIIPQAEDKKILSFCQEKITDFNLETCLRQGSYAEFEKLPEQGMIYYKARNYPMATVCFEAAIKHLEGVSSPALSHKSDLYFCYYFLMEIHRVFKDIESYEENNEKGMSVLASIHHAKLDDEDCFNLSVEFNIIGDFYYQLSPRELDAAHHFYNLTLTFATGIQKMSDQYYRVVAAAHGRKAEIHSQSKVGIEEAECAELDAAIHCLSEIVIPNEKDQQLRQRYERKLADLKRDKQQDERFDEGVRIASQRFFMEGKALKKSSKQRALACVKEAVELHRYGILNRTKEDNETLDVYCRQLDKLDPTISNQRAKFFKLASQTSKLDKKEGELKRLVP